MDPASYVNQDRCVDRHGDEDTKDVGPESCSRGVEHVEAPDSERQEQDYAVHRPGL